MQHTLGIDRGVTRAVQTSLEKEDFFDLAPEEKILNKKSFLDRRKEAIEGIIRR